MGTSTFAKLNSSAFSWTEPRYHDYIIKRHDEIAYWRSDTDQNICGVSLRVVRIRKKGLRMQPWIFDCYCVRKGSGVLLGYPGMNRRYDWVLRTSNSNVNPWRNEHFASLASRWRELDPWQLSCDGPESVTQLDYYASSLTRPLPINSPNCGLEIRTSRPSPMWGTQTIRCGPRIAIVEHSLLGQTAGRILLFRWVGRPI